MNLLKQCSVSSLWEDAGQALIETSLSTSLLLLFLLGAAELARAAYAAIEVSNAAKAAAQYGAQNVSTAADSAAIRAAAAMDAPDLPELVTTVGETGICSDGSECSGSSGTCMPTDCSASRIETILTVKTEATYKPLLQIRGLSSSLTLHGEAVQKVLNY